MGARPEDESGKLKPPGEPGGDRGEGCRAAPGASGALMGSGAGAGKPSSSHAAWGITGICRTLCKRPPEGDRLGERPSLATRRRSGGSAGIPEADPPSNTRGGVWECSHLHTGQRESRAHASWRQLTWNQWDGELGGQQNLPWTKPTPCKHTLHFGASHAGLSSGGAAWELTAHGDGGAGRECACAAENSGAAGAALADSAACVKTGRTPAGTPGT